MDKKLLLMAVEAALATAGGEPVTPAQLAAAWSAEGVSPDTVRKALEELAQLYQQEERGLRVEQVAGGWRLVTAPETAPYLDDLARFEQRRRLSKAAFEVLAVVAYKQPVTLPEINQIRGANSAAALHTLMERGLVTIAGRKDVVGRPFLYKTTKDFLLAFGLNSLSDLPDPQKLMQADQ